MFSSLKLLLILVIAMLALSGCGDLLGKKVIKKELDPSQFQVDCDLDVNQFSEIMNKNISSQIKCLGENLNLFIRLVKSGKPDHLSRVQLEKYLADFRPDVKPEVIKALKSVFELGHVITGEDPDYISKQTVEKVINFVLKFNEEAALNFGPIFQSEAQVSYDLHRNHQYRVNQASLAIMNALGNVFVTSRNGQIHKISIIKLIESFTTEDNKEVLEKVRKLLFIKKLVLGGDEEHLTHLEIEKIILNFDQLVRIVLDAVRFSYIDLELESILQLLKVDVDSLYSIIRGVEHRDSAQLFSMNQAYEAVKVFIGTDDFDIDRFRNLIDEAKILLVNGNKQVVTGIEVKRLFDHATSILKTGNFFYQLWDKFKVQLMSPLPITIDFSEYRHNYPEYQIELDQFARIVKRYRFQKGEFLAPYYTNGYKRNPSAIFEIAVYEYLLKIIFVNYGQLEKSSAIGSYVMSQENMQKLVKKFEKELIDLDLLFPNKANSLADNISLLGTLFQYQSDENSFLDVNEASEFATTVLTGLELDDDIYDFIRSQDNCTIDEFGRIDPECYRSHFWQAMCENYQGNFPLLFKSFNINSCEELETHTEARELLMRSVEAGRTCNRYTDGNKEEIPYSKGDIMTTLVVLMHVETTILRWDANNNNQLDEDELNRAFKIYSPALDGFLKDKNEIIKRFKKQIYQYLIKYEEIPNEEDFGSIWKFIKFLLKFDKNLVAKRKTMASILVAISNENAKLRTGPDFNCNYLRDPENIPREVSTPAEPPVASGTDYSSLLKPYLYLSGDNN